MKCSKCQFKNPQGMKFCGECGAKLDRICPACRHSNLPQFKFCGQCGQQLNEKKTKESLLPGIESERKHVTVLFSDLSGYTALSEKLDPEEVKEITTQIFSAISQVISEYDGFVEKFVGDAVMALFGVPEAHEDDPIRAIRVAKRIHDLVNTISPDIEKRIGKSLSMHTGITTGLVVTGEVHMKSGTHGVAGDPINLASRLSSLATPGEILVGPYTYRQAEGHFSFASLEPITLKGKTAPVQIYRVLEQKERPIKMHRITGVKADLTGR